MASLWDALKQYVGDSLPGGALNPEVSANGTIGGLLSTAAAPLQAAAKNKTVKALLDWSADNQKQAEDGFNAQRLTLGGQPYTSKDVGDAMMYAGVAPVGMTIPKQAQLEALSKLEAMQRGEIVNPTIKNGLIPTQEQQSIINHAFSELTNGKQPPYNQSSMDLALNHIFDSRISGRQKPSGRMADSFDPKQTVDWLSVAGDDAANVVTDFRGRPGLENIYTDQSTGKSYKVRIPISGDLATGRQWASGLIPEIRSKNK